MSWPLQFSRRRWQGLAAVFRQRFRQTGARAAPCGCEAAWRRDPLSHPALQCMTQRDLGDLPFDPYAVDPD